MKSCEMVTFLKNGRLEEVGGSKESYLYQRVFFYIYIYISDSILQVNNR